MGDDLQIGLHLGIRSRGTANQDETPLSVFFLEHHDRIHGMAHPLSRLQAIGMIRFQMPVGHPVIQQNTGITRDETRSERAL